ncbi:RagB/SusD family nutrient uptake outer membrane protein [Sphingobacterium sp. UT-1RO-CII-1]|uniref:RagB/SusD family nutrient uptake outer membrane protein n=1 Tax=Sphingobacterium sp. UT-1RO-CII-1 TaxID=2995225 RepID=UPI00227B7589|nr:RagB/SusD family nutrient uptake outer membrane protein [Sphingobacterium sp. UT-1RO-CII-1]MCY4781206.1 RagB/SusD family nutrient uptake outer membrane protein [Sphingobacterium sp. UT-1RO-CII-1]
MKNIFKYIYLLCFYGVMMLFIGCGESFLDQKPVQNQQVPSTLDDYQAMMDHRYINSFPAYLSMIGGESFTIAENMWESFPLGGEYYQKNAFIWADDVFEGADSHDYNVGYGRILICNIVLDGLNKYEGDKSGKQYKQVKGTALFHRARFYYNLAQLFATPYGEQGTDQYGLPFYLTSSVATAIDRKSVTKTYEQIINDLIEALDLLEENSYIPEKPNKASCFAMLARVYLQMGEFENANKYANQSLSLHDELLDYNSLDVSSAYPFPVNGKENPEIIFLEYGSGGTFMGAARLDITGDLLDLYDAGDLRGQAYVNKTANGRKVFKGSYMGTYSFFTGLTTAEMYLVRAESATHLNKLDEALADINKLRENRYDRLSYILYDEKNKNKVLEYLFNERGRELAFRNRRWEDIRRWNVFTDSEKSLLRTMKNQQYMLLPNDAKWTWPFPDLAVQEGGYQQNPR